MPFHPQAATRLRRLLAGRLTVSGSPPLVAAILLLALAIALPTDLFRDDYSLVVTDGVGQLLGALLSDDGFWRFPPIDEIPARYRAAVLAFEDKRFYRHIGIDPVALARAIWLDVSQGRIVSGGSTITMQTARLGLQYRRRGIPQKAVEMLVALKLTVCRSKDDVLRMFASHAPLGGNVVGLEAAAWRYFGRPAATLSWAESATLAVLPNAPSLIHLKRNRGLLLDKRNRLLEKLYTTSVIDADTLRLSMAEGLPPEPYPIPLLAPHLVFSIKAGVFGPMEDHRVVTSLRLDWQRRASEIVSDHLRSLAANGVRNACCLVLENATGAVMAYVGNSPDIESAPSGHVDIVHQPRSTGSILKPFLYAAMIHEGLILPGELIADVPTRFPGFAPENNTRSYRGAVPAYMALARSLNIPAIRLLRDYSVDKLAGDLKALGMTTLFREAAEYGLTLIVGGAEGTLWELTGMYAGLARNAMGARAPYFAPSILAGKDRSSSGSDRYSAGAAYLTLDALLQVQRPGIEESWESFSSSETIAWKTGTSQGFRDAWAIGVTRDYTVGVWVGNADGEPRPELGGTAAAGPILFAIFDMLPDSAWFEEPLHELKSVEVCARSGRPPGPSCEETREAKIPISAHVPGPCPYCITVHLDPGGRFRTNTTLERGGPILNVGWFVLPPAMEWYYRQGNADYQVLPPYRQGAEADASPVPITIIYPQEGSTIYIPRDLDAARGRVVAEAVHRSAHISVFWHLDADYLGATEDIHVMAVSPPPGEHVLVLIDADGEMVERRFTILSGEQGRGSGS